MYGFRFDLSLFNSGLVVFYSVEYCCSVQVLVQEGTWLLRFRLHGDLLFFQQRKKSKQKNAALGSLTLNLKSKLRVPENCMGATGELYHKNYYFYALTGSCRCAVRA